MIKKSVFTILLLLIATNLWAVKTIDVSSTVHNLGTQVPDPYSYYRSGNEDEVCIYCHTPHGGTLNTPLWNRGLAAASSFTHYSSATLSSYMKGIQTRDVNVESLLCMSCHDGVVAMNAIINNSNRTVGGAPDNAYPMNSMEFWSGFGIGKVIGDAPDATNSPMLNSRNLTDDHPISFNYVSAVAVSGGKLDTLANAKLDGVRFFGAAKENVECSSCHDPHVDSDVDTAYAPFLTMPNTASALCLACHVK